MNNEGIAACIDHAVLNPDAIDTDVIVGAKLAAKYNVATLCVRPCDVALAEKHLRATNVGVSTVIGFPHGSNHTNVKTLEALLAIAHGVAELDMVMNIGEFLSGNYNGVLEDIRAVVNIAERNNIPVKVILETCYLSSSMIYTACQLAKAAGAIFVKTSTGFGPGGATLEATAAMLSASGTAMSVKASGGIKTRETTIAYIQQGCLRIGTSHTEAILNDN